MDVRPLRTTHFFDLDLRGLDVSDRLRAVGDERWLAAVDDWKEVLVTQLGMLSSAEGRDGVYFYAMAVGRRLYLIRNENNSPCIVRSAMDGKFPTSSAELPERELVLLGARGIMVLLQHALNSHSVSRPTILGADGLPMRTS